MTINHNILYGSLFVFNMLLYFICIIIILIKRKYSCISIRSPVLLICNNFSGWFMTSLLIINTWRVKGSDSLANYIHILDIVFCLYYPFQSLMIIAYSMRCLRVINCCSISQEEKKNFTERRDKYVEKHYIKLMLLLFVFVIVITGISNTLMWSQWNSRLAPEIFFEGNDDPYESVNAHIWIVVSFIENFILISFCYLTSIKGIQHKVQIEIFLFTFVWIVLSYFISALDFGLKDTFAGKEEYVLLICLMLLYGCLVLNGLLPICLSFKKTFQISFHFNPQLMNNFYLFLTNEECYRAFSDYVERRSEFFYLKLYTHIMKYKLEFQLNPSNVSLPTEREAIIEKYFTNTFNKENEFVNIAQTIIKANSSVSDITSAEKVFDDALKYSYEVLNKCFIEFQNTQHFQILYDDLKTSSYIHCKMYNTGLIGEF